MNLYNIADQLREIADSLADGIDDDGEIPDDLASSIDALNLAMEAKIDGCCVVRAEMLARAAAYEGEMKRLQRLRDAAQARADWIRQYVGQCMTVAGVERIKCPLFSVRWQRNSMPSVTLTCSPSELPKAYQVTWIEENKKALIEAYKNGVEVVGVEINVGKHVRIT